jgi:predicted outer membrane protein
MDSKTWLAGVGCVIYVLAATDAASQSPEESAVLAEAAPALAVNDDERQTLNQLHASNVLLVEAGRLAEGRARSPTLKRFGRQLVRRQTEADRELRMLAQHVGMTLQTPDDRDALTPLRRTWSAALFDREFLNLLARDSESAIARLQATQQGDTQAVQVYLDRVLLGAELRQQQVLQQLDASPF